MSETKMRVQKFLANNGVASRREIERMINAGRISINGVTVKIQGVKVNPATDQVAVDGKVVTPKDPFQYVWLNKPVGVLSAAKDHEGRETVIDLVPSEVRLYPVGRLDLNSQGLLLLTNDGELTHRLTHPRYHVPKTYQVLVAGPVTDKKLLSLSTGIELEEGKTAPADIRELKQSKSETLLEIVLYEGRHRQIRRMATAVGLTVLELTRVAFGPVKLKNLLPGNYRPATAAEMRTLKAAAGLD